MYIVQTYRTYLGRLITTAYLFPKLKLRNCPKHLTTKSLKFCQNIYIKLSPEIPQNCPRNCVQIIYNFTISQIPKSSLLTQILAGILKANPTTHSKLSSIYHMPHHVKKYTNAKRPFPLSI